MSSSAWKTFNATGSSALLSRWVLLSVRYVLRASQHPGIQYGFGSRILTKVFGFPTVGVGGDKRRKESQTAWLDGLRGVAALLVVIYHYNLDTFGYWTVPPYGAPHTGAWDLWRLPLFRIVWCSGPLQVGIFFVLSGCVLSWPRLLAIREGRHEKFARDLSSAVLRRWLRLFTPCFIVGLLSLLQFWYGLIELKVERKSSFLVQFWDYIQECERFANPFQLERNQLDLRHAYNDTMWTMPVEWAGSLAVFLILVMVCRIRSYFRRTLILVIVPAYTCLSARWNYWLFTTGVLLADYIQEVGGFVQLSTNLSFFWRVFWALILLIGLWVGGIPEKQYYYTRPGYEWTDVFVPTKYVTIEGGQRWFWSWGGIIIVVSLSHIARLRQFFERPGCRYLGRISFMLYLTHRMIGKIVGPSTRGVILKLFGTEYTEPLDPDTKLLHIVGWFWNIFAYGLVWLVLLPLALALANWATILVDEPSIKFAKWVDEWFAGGLVVEPQQRNRKMHEVMRLPK